jgi:cellulose synthase/poly-beta-1,6-N-acetylglucosamine synthase-like glycosyltransferase
MAATHFPTDKKQHLLLEKCPELPTPNSQLYPIFETVSPTPLSVVIITFNEERNIGRCLDAVKDIADDIVVLDSFSTDKTEEVCKAACIRRTH